MEGPILLFVMVLVVGVGAQWLAWRVRLPAIILLAAGGLLIGPVAGWVPHGPEMAHAVEPAVALCVAVILFEGGLSLQRSELRVAARGVRRLVYVGDVHDERGPDGGFVCEAVAGGDHGGAGLGGDESVSG